jgi:ferredoxin
VRGPFTTSEAAFSVRLVNAAMGIDRVVPCEPGEWVLDAADRAGIVLPSSCRNGGCLTCTGRLLTDTPTEMGDQYTLEEEHTSVGFRLLCVCRVDGDATILTHQQDEVE